ncbi:MAG: hypothetical protein NZ765_11055 [Anaerolineae bacterium]|nr:hypothetical protein [Anaerolineae bacterium]
MWRALRFVEGDYDLFVHLYHLESERRVGQVNKALGDSLLLYSQIWPPNLSLVEMYRFTIPSDALEGVYRFELGLYHRTSLTRIPVMIGDQWSVTGSVILGKLRVQDTPSPHPMFELSAHFEDNISLLGLDLSSPNTLDTLSITLYWQVRELVSYDYTVFVHLVDGRGDLVAQQDNMPQRGRYPTSWWDPGEIVLDTYSLGPLPKSPNERYWLRIGLYNLSTGIRLRLLGQEKDYVEVLLEWSDGHLSPQLGATSNCCEE